MMVSLEETCRLKGIKKQRKGEEGGGHSRGGEGREKERRGGTEGNRAQLKHSAEGCNQALNYEEK